MFHARVTRPSAEPANHENDLEFAEQLQLEGLQQSALRWQAAAFLAWFVAIVALAVANLPAIVVALGVSPIVVELLPAIAAAVLIAAGAGFIVDAQTRPTAYCRDDEWLQLELRQDHRGRGRFWLGFALVVAGGLALGLGELL